MKALITGASSGIGREFALYLAELGYDLIICSRSTDKLNALKDEIKNEEDCYYPFRGATFAKEHIAPRVADYIKRANNKETEKFANVFNVQYGNGDRDTRAVITIVILNSLEDEEFYKVSEFFNDDLEKAAKAARKYKGKEVKPEVPKKPRKSIGSTLLNQSK